MNPRYSIVIPVFNRRESLSLLSGCLKAQTLPPEKFECIVVDDDSTGGTGKSLESLSAGCEISTVASKPGLGRGGAMDVGWQESRGEFVVFLDCDMLPAPDWLETLDAAFATGRFDIVSGSRYHVNVEAEKELTPQIASLIGRDPEELFGSKLRETFQSLHAHAKPGQYAHPVFAQLESQLPSINEEYPRSVINAYACHASNVAIRRDLLGRTSGFNPYLRKFELIELGIRLWELGARFGFAEGAGTYHLNSQEPSAPWLDYGEARAFFCLHPYQLVALMNLWGVYQSSGAPASPPACFRLLLDLQRANEGVLPFDVSQEYVRVYRQPLPVDCRISKADLIKHYTSGNPLWTDATVAEALDQAVERGLFVGRKGSEVYFDFMHTGNWIRDCTPSLGSWLRKYILNGKKTRFRRTQKHADLLSLHFTGKYEVSFPSNWFEAADTPATLNIPLPTEHECQKGVKIANCFPENLSSYVERSQGMVVGFPVAKGEGEVVRVSYEFECEVHEFAPPEHPITTRETDNMTRFLRVAMPPPYLATAGSLLRQIVPEGLDDAYSIALLIYDWIQHSLVFSETPFMYPYYLILDTGFGPCIQQTRLFINLCRMMKIPAREMCGALLPYDVASEAPQTAETTLYGTTPFIHTWAEFYDPLRGWIPVEVHGFGDKTVTGLNLPDAQLRDELRTIYQQVYTPYLFGNLHPFRVFTSEQANKAPVYPVFKSSMGGRTLSEMQLEIATKLASQLSYTLTRLN